MTTSLEKYSHIQKACDRFEYDTPLERLRFFCSIAFSAQDWLDSEHFFDALENQIIELQKNVN